jgi:diacylglycerol kinase family enzyme
VRLKVVLNASAGTLMGMGPDEAARRVREGFRRAGRDEPEVELVPGSDVAAALERACGEDVDAVVVGGGDGTIATAAHHLVGKRVALGILPLGTMNLMAKDLGIPLGLEEAVEALARGEVRAIDACTVNGHVFLNNSVLGLYPRMVEERERQRGAHHLRKWPAMFLAAFRSLWHFPLLQVSVETDGVRRRLLTPILAVANNAYDEGYGRLLQRSRLDAGRMGVYLARHRSPLGLVWLMLRLFVGGWQRNPELETLVVAELRVRAFRRRIRVANDGEVLRLKPPLEYRVHPGALKVLVPRPEDRA